MAAKNVGTLIREARTAKKLSQEQLASGIDGLSGTDVGKAERGEKELSQAQLKAIAKALGITQKSLLEAPKGGAASTAASTKTGTAKKTASASKAGTAKTTTASKTGKTTKKTASSTTSAAKKTGTAEKTSTAKKTSSASSAKTSNASSLSSAEQKLIELYRAASSDNKKLAAKILKGEGLELSDLLPMLKGSGSGDDGLLGALLGKLQGLGK